MARSLYSVPHTAFLSFNPGTGKQVQAEIRDLLANLFLSTKYSPTLTAHKSNEFELSSISLYSLVELLMRSQTLENVKLKIASADVYFENSFRNFIDKVNWELYLPQNTRLHLRLNSVGSRLFHESMLRETFVERVGKKIGAKIVGNDEEALTTVYVDILNNVCTISISLAGKHLYQRGFREIGGAVAPLREDLAQICIRNALSFCREHAKDYTARNLWVPFGGTGTFVFEYLMYEHRIAPCLLGRSYALQSLPFFNKKNFDFVIAKAASIQSKESVEQVSYSDFASEVCEIFAKNLSNFSLRTMQEISRLHSALVDMTSEKPSFASGDVFIPLNPPYGLRLHSQSEISPFYAKIAKHLLEVRQDYRFGGFVLCPSEEAWSAFFKVLAPHAKMATHHMSQGGLDIRVCLFLF